MTNGEPKERRETRETDRSHRLTITSKPFNHQQWSQDGGDRRWPLEVIERRDKGGYCHPSVVCSARDSCPFAPYGLSVHISLTSLVTTSGSPVTTV